MNLIGIANYLSVKWRRQQQIKKTGNPDLINCYSQALPALNTPFNKLNLMVMDMEMSGLEAHKDQIISVGWVDIENGQITHKSAFHSILKTQNIELKNTASIHQIFDSHLQKGVNRDQVIQQFLNHAKGKILVFHHAKIVLRFLNKAFQSAFAQPAAFLSIDTLERERKLQKNHSLKTNKFTLAECRKRYGLPQYKAHNAVIDAIATAELLLAQISHTAAIDKVKLIDLI